MAVVAESVLGGEGGGSAALGLWIPVSTSSATLGPRQHGEGSRGKGGVNRLHGCREELAFGGRPSVRKNPEERKQATAGPRNDVPEGHWRELDRLLKENTEEGGPLVSSQQSYAGVRGHKCGHLDLGAQDQVKSCEGGRFQVSVRKLSDADPGGAAVPRGSKSSMLRAAGCWGR